MRAHITEHDVIEIARMARIRLFEGETALLAEELDVIVGELEGLLAFEGSDTREEGVRWAW